MFLPSIITFLTVNIFFIIFLNTNNKSFQDNEISNCCECGFNLFAKHLASKTYKYVTFGFPYSPRIVELLNYKQLT